MARNDGTRPSATSVSELLYAPRMQWSSSRCHARQLGDVSVTLPDNLTGHGGADLLDLLSSAADQGMLRRLSNMGKHAAR